MTVQRKRSLVLRGALVLGMLVAVGLVSVRLLRPAPRNVVLILIDTLRADHLGTYGYTRPTSPFLDELAARGVVFENVVSAASATFPSVNSLFTSRPPNVFSKKEATDLGIPEQMTTLAEVFSANGFRTGAVSASPIVRRSPSYVNGRGGFGQGFEQFDESCSAPNDVLPYTARCVTEKALRMLASFDGSRFFLYIHYLDPHDPYQPPQRWNRFAQMYDGNKPFIKVGRTEGILKWLYEGGSDPGVTDAEIQHLRDLYDGEILAIDAELRKLFEGFVQRDKIRETLFVLVADHGESFMEHRHIQHGRSVYEEQLHVPLIFHWTPRWQGPLRRKEIVCSIDVMPTLLRLVGLSVPRGAGGVALFDTWPWERAHSHMCASEGRDNWRSPYGNPVSVRMGSYKIIYDRSRDAYEAFDLASDPHELRNLAPQDGATGAPRFVAMQRALALLFLPPTVQRAGCERPVALDPQVERALKALGYVH